jgi:hypothetical protein
MVNAIGSLVLRPDPIRHAIYRAYQKLPRAIAISLEMWSNDLTYGRLIDAAEKAGDREELQSLFGEASMYRSMLEDERLERESLRLETIARRHLVAIPHYDGHDENIFWEQSHRNGRIHLTIQGIAEARKAIDDDFKRRWGRRMFWINLFGTLGILKIGWDLLKVAF